MTNSQMATRRTIRAAEVILHPSSLILVLRSFILCLLLAALPGHAQTYPTKSVRMIVPFAPGGGTDIIARLVAQELNQAWGQSVVVDNRGGSGGIVGTELAARAAPDGYTMMLCSLAFSYAPALYSKLPYDTAKDFAPVSLVATQPFIFVAIPTLGANSIKELVA